MTLVTPRWSMGRSTLYDEDLGEVVDLSGHSTWANGDIYEIIQDLVEALSHLQAMAKGHEVRLATTVRALLQTSQDRGSGVPERLQSLDASIVALSVPLSKRGARRLRRCLNVSEHRFYSWLYTGPYRFTNVGTTRT